MNADELRATIERVEHDLKWAIWPHGDEARVVAGLEREDQDQFGEALRLFKGARYALHPNTAGGVNLQEAARLVGEACELLDRIPHWRIPPEVNAERAIAVRDLSARVGRPL